MDRNQLTGIAIITAMLITYTHFFSPQEPVQPVATQASPVVIQEAPIAKATTNPNSIFATLSQGKEQEVTLENEVLRVTLSSRGGTVKEVVLKKFKDHNSQPLKLLDAQSSKMGFQLAAQGIKANTQDLFFSVDQQAATTADKSSQATFTLALGPKQYLRQQFSLSSKGYTLEHNWEMVGLDTVLDAAPIELIWDNHIKQTETNLGACRSKTTINYCLEGGNFDQLRENSDQLEERQVDKPMQWLAIKQRFFTAGIIAQSPFSGAYLATQPTTHKEGTVKEAKVHVQLPAHTKQQHPKGRLSFYFGPNDYQELSKVAPHFHRNVPLGWSISRTVNRYLVIPIFSFLAKYISNYGLLVTLLVIVIKLLLLPLSYRSYIAMAKMKALKPALDAIKEKHGDDFQKIQMAQVRLYQEVGINPLSSIIPILLQMPILLAMFNLFSNLIDLRQASFLWASDLSTYDSVLQLPFHIPIYGSHVSLFALLMTASTVLYTWSNTQMTAAPDSQMQMMTYIMPAVFLVVLNSFPAGLSFYYFISNLFTYAQQALIKYFVDEEDIKQKLEENKHRYRNSNKSRVEEKLGAAMKLERSIKKKSNEEL